MPLLEVGSQAWWVFEGVLQFSWSFLPEHHLPCRKGQWGKQTSKWQKNTVYWKNPVVVCGNKSADQSCIHHVWLLSLPLCRTRLSFNKETKKCWNEDQGRASEFVCALTEGWKEFQSLFLIPSLPGTKGTGGNIWRGEGDLRAWFYFRTCIPCSQLYVPEFLHCCSPCPVPASALSWASGISAPFPGWCMERGGASASPEGRTFQILFGCICIKWQPVFFSWD